MSAGAGALAALETYISGTGLELDYLKIANERIKGHEIIEKAEAGDIVAESVIQFLKIALDVVLQ